MDINELFSLMILSDNGRLWKNEIYIANFINTYIPISNLIRPVELLQPDDSEIKSIYLYGDCTLEKFKNVNTTRGFFKKKIVIEKIKDPKRSLFIEMLVILKSFNNTIEYKMPLKYNKNIISSLNIKNEPKSEFTTGLLENALRIKFCQSNNINIIDHNNLVFLAGENILNVNKKYKREFYCLDIEDETE